MPDSDDIATAAESPKTVSSDGTTVQDRDISEMIEADRYSANESARASSVLPIRFFSTKPPGAV